MSLESVADELRALRRRIDAQRANTHVWPTKEEELAADVDRYDRRLIKAAAMLQVVVPASRRRDGILLSDDDRVRLEQRVAEAGLDLGTRVDRG
jgi:hypothetical protein